MLLCQDEIPPYGPISLSCGPRPGNIFLKLRKTTTTYFKLRQGERKAMARRDTLI